MPLPYTLSTKPLTQIGMVVLQSDESLEQDLRRLLPAQAELLVTRVPSAEELTQASISEMEGNLTTAAKLLPRSAQCRVVGYGCTSASAQIGPNRVAALIKAGVQTAHVTEPVSALIAACRALGITRIGLISPYIAAISDRLRMALTDQGITVSTFASFEEPMEANVVRITSKSLVDAATQMGADPNCDAVFLSCTNLRTLDVIDQIETAIHKPVLSSNQVLGWHLTQLAGLAPAPGAIPGQLGKSAG